jgi:hypothetical protein
MHRSPERRPEPSALIDHFSKKLRMAFEHQSRQPRNRPGESPNGRREAGVWATCWGHVAVSFIAFVEAQTGLSTGGIWTVACPSGAALQPCLLDVSTIM